MTKIAFPTEDGRTIHQHFGRAPYFTVAAVDESGAVRFEQRGKAYHGEPQAGQTRPEPHAAPHGHAGMFAPIADCQVLIAGGMGRPAYQRALDAGLKVILTGETSISAALAAYRAGALASDERRIHQHR
jgi:predicted Fe-Mo cluster-binding NifX family protein